VVWSLSDEELLNILNEATKLELDTEFIDLIQCQIRQRKAKYAYSLLEENFKNYINSIDLCD